MKTKKIVCYNCGGHGFITATYENGQTSAICTICGGIGSHEIQMTNADRIRSMSDEELAWELMLWRCEAVARNHGISSEYPDTQQTILKWLQQPAGEEDKHEAD